MGHPTWHNALASSLIRTLERSKTFPLHLAPQVSDAEGELEGKVIQLQEDLKRLEEQVAALGESQQASLHVVLVFVELKLAFLSDQAIAKLLRHCGVKEPEALCKHEPKALRATLERENKRLNLVDKVPDVEQVASWVMASKTAEAWLDPGRSGAAAS